MRVTTGSVPLQIRKVFPENVTIISKLNVGPCCDVITGYLVALDPVHLEVCLVIFFYVRCLAHWIEKPLGTGMKVRDLSYEQISRHPEAQDYVLNVS